jgi:hypothetical protein
MELGETCASGDQVAFSFVFDATGRGGLKVRRGQASA